MSFSVVIGPTGPIAPTYADILAYLRQLVRSIYGSDINLDDDSQDGQMLAIIATAIHDCNDSVIAAYNSFSPATAQGVGLSNVVKINGIRRLTASNSTATVLIVGQVGTVINRGQISDQAGIRWALPDEVIIPDAGQIEVTATAVDPGAIPASPNTLTTIVTPTRGWQTVNNPAAADLGLPVETDATLRARQSVSTQIPALSVVGAILGAIKNLIGVGRAVIYENDTGAPDSNGIPAHSICAVVEGGDIDSIGAAIARYKTPGTGTFGDTTVTVQDGVGVPIDISFDELELIEMAVLVYLDALTGYVNTTGDLIKAAVAAWFNGFAIGQDSALSKLWSPVNLMGDAATSSSGKTQAQLDALSNTYNALQIYQARPDMAVVGGPYAAGSVAITVGNGDDYTIGDKIAVTLDNGDIHRTTVANKVGDVVTMTAAVPGGRSIANGVLMYLAADLTILFNQAASADAADTDLEGFLMPLYWDQPDQFWDSGLTWDAGDSPNPGNVQPYLDKVTAEHNDKPDFMAMLTGYLQPLADGVAVGNSLPVLFDIDLAVGVQLDIIGLWVGRSRELTIPITNVFFTFNTGPGFNVGVFKSRFAPSDELVLLPDEQYRTLLKATIAANHWDGTVLGATEASAIVFGPGGYTTLIIDHQDMTMTVILGGPVPDAVTLALLLGGYLSLKPAGVRISEYIVSANATKKIFTFNAPPTSPVIGGFNDAAFATHYEGT